MTDTPKEEKPQKKPFNNRWLPSLMAVVALVIAIFAAIGMALAWHSQKQTGTEFHNLTQELDKLKQTQQQSQNQTNQFKQQVDTITTQLTQLNQRQGVKDKSWELAESQYLIKLAVYNVSLVNNPALAM